MISLIRRHHILYGKDKPEHGKMTKCSACGWQAEYWEWAWAEHFKMVRVAHEEPPKKIQLVGTAISATGRSQWRWWLDHLALTDETPYREPGWLEGNQRADWQRLAEVIRKATARWEETGKPWGLDTGPNSRSPFNYFSTHPWIVGIEKPGTSKWTAQVYSTRLDAYGFTLRAMGNKVEHGWDVEMGVEVVDKDMTVKVINSPVNHLADLISRAKTTSIGTQVKLIREIDESLEAMELLREARKDLITKMF